MDDQLTIATQTEPDGAAILQLHGIVDLATRQTLLDAATTLLNTTETADAAGSAGAANGVATSRPPSTLIVNLAGVTFLDSSGIGALVTIANQARDKQIGFAIGETSTPARRILQIAGLDQIWRIDTDNAPAPPPIS